MTNSTSRPQEILLELCDTLRYDTNDTNDTFLPTFSGVSYRIVSFVGRIVVAYGRIVSYRIAYFLFFKANL